MKKYLVNQIVPKKGERISTKEYRKKLNDLGYNFYQQIGSLGGAKSAGTIDISHATVIRM